MQGAGGAPLRVCYFNRSYWPDTGATGQLLTELAEDLVSKHGIEVTVVTGYPVNSTEPLASRQTRNGVHIVRARGTTFPTRRFAGRAMNYVTYFFSALVAALGLPRQDVTIALTDPPIIGLAAIAARPRHGVIFFCQDIFPEVAGLLEDFHSPAINALLERLNRFMVRRAVRIIALGDTMASRLIHGKGADPGKITVIHNWADTSAIVPSEKRNAFAAAHGLDAKFVVLHAGNIGLSQNLDVVIEAAGLLKTHRDIVILFIGDGNRRAALQAAAESRGLDNVTFLPFQPRDQLRWTYASSDVCLVSLKPGLAGYIVPSKLYPILAAGRPYIAAVEPVSEVAALTQRHRCGVLVEPGDAAQLADAILRLADQSHERAAMGTRARVASELFARDRQVAAHAQVIEEVAG
ncbi:MAG TPA: glycosyltransferase family 4 protein [Vicinamibacterales bacterium]|jgi:colanic acid biosynthesis glycosyl transferase WcaI|nr:glycosyltransferase family 4 protein [Vicinamibacterales bacterium]